MELSIGELRMRWGNCRAVLDEDDFIFLMRRVGGLQAVALLRGPLPPVPTQDQIQDYSQALALAERYIQERAQERRNEILAQLHRLQEHPQYPQLDVDLHELPEGVLQGMSTKRLRYLLKTLKQQLDDLSAST